MLRWPDGFRCPRCCNDEAWSRRNGLYECAGCGLQTSVTSGAIFQDTKKPLRVWFRAIWHVTGHKYGANALGLQRVLGLGSYRTAWSWLHKLRRAMVRPSLDRLSGVVQVDESYIGGEKPGKRGRGAAGKSLILIAAQVDGTRIGRVRLRRIPDASAASLETAVQQSVEPGSVVRTDRWQGYNQLSRFGYTHELVRQGADVGGNLLPFCHKTAGILKRWLLGTLQGAVSQEHLDYYLDEFTFRFNRRTSRSRGKRFYRLVQQAGAIEPVPVKCMVKHVRGRPPQHKIWGLPETSAYPGTPIPCFPQQYQSVIVTHWFKSGARIDRTHC
jgi:transposase-like protein